MTVRADRDDAAMIRIDILEQVVAHRESIRHLLVTSRSEGNDVIGAVSMRVDHLPFGGDRTGEPVAFDGEVRQRVPLDGTAMFLDLAPRNPAIVVAVEPDGEVEITQRDIPLAVELVEVPGVGPKRKVGVALLVRERYARQQHECREQNRDPTVPAQRPLPDAAAWAAAAVAGAA